MLIALVAAQMGLARASPADFVRYEVGGLMSGPYRLQVDLGNGDVEEESVDRAGQGAAHLTRHYHLSAADLSSIRSDAAALVLHDATAARCRKPGSLPLPPTMDALVSLYLRVRGRDTAAGPNPSCFSTQADAFINGLTAMLKRTPVLPD